MGRRKGLETDHQPTPGGALPVSRKVAQGRQSSHPRNIQGAGGGATPYSQPRPAMWLLGACWSDARPPGSEGHQWGLAWALQLPRSLAAEVPGPPPPPHWSLILLHHYECPSPSGEQGGMELRAGRKEELRAGAPGEVQPYLALLHEAIEHAQNEARPEHVQQLQQHQKPVEEVVAEEGAPVGDGLVVCGVEDPTARGRGGGWGLTSCCSPQS